MTFCMKIHYKHS